MGSYDVYKSEVFSGRIFVPNSLIFVFRARYVTYLFTASQYSLATKCLK